MIKEKYNVKVVREPGCNPITNEFCDYAEQQFEVHATSRQNAFKISHTVCNISFCGQIRRTFINGEEYFSNHY